MYNFLLVKMVDPTDKLATDPLDQLDSAQLLIPTDESAKVATIAVLDDQVGLVLLPGGVVESHEVLILYDVLVVELRAYHKFMKLLFDVFCGHF
jgi:hypothetical protein